MRLVRALCCTLLAAAPLSAQTKDIGPAPGRLVDVGGRKLHLHCTGAGAPTVVLEAGASAFAIDWSLVQPEIARTNRVCSYDRAGHGWSDPAKAVTTPERVALDLHAALAAAGEKPPYVMVGASMGGIYVRIYQARHPDDIVGMVLVDPAHEDRLFTMYRGEGVTIASLTAEQLRSTMPSRPVPVPRRSVQTGAPFDKLPRELYELRLAFETRLIAAIPESVSPEVVIESSEGGRAAFAELHQISAAQGHPLGDRPLVVLSRSADASKEMKEVHATAARLSSNSRHTVVEGAGHEIHLFEPPVVIQAIRDVLDAAKNGTKLPAQ